MDEYVKEFLVESYENLDRLDRDLVALEKDPRSRETLDSIFRTIHTIKGTSGFLGFGRLEAVAHVGENLLGKLRDEIFVVSPAITTALLRLVDAVRYILSQIESGGDAEGREFTDLILELTRLHEGGAQSVVSIAPLSHPIAVTEEAEAAFVIPPAPESIRAATPPPQVRPVLPPVVQVAQASKFEGVSSEHPADGIECKASSVSDSTIRVDVGLLDKLMNLVGELVLARNQVLQFSSRCNETALQATSQRLNLITTELQESVMKTRMQPIGNVWSKLPRVVRDLAAACGKDVRLEMEGRETELDKTIIEAIKDPLTHIVRNAVDHGIEAHDVRVARGKDAEGCLKMRAFHEGGQVNIEISDDGGGIDTARVRQKALDRGLVTAEQAARMSDHEAFHLIFLPGFSTAEKITNVSGRGVGMDVVKTNIEKIGGTVDLHSQLGEGTTLKIKIPLTLAIIPALIVTSCGDRFAVPQVSLLELVRLEPEQAAQQIELVHGTPVYRLRGQLLPLVYLNEQLKIEVPGAMDGDSPINIVVLQADGRPFGLVVNHINDTEEIVVKPLGKQLKGVPVFAGATIMGDGRVALILDVLGIAQRSGVVCGDRNRSLVDASTTRRNADSCQTLLVFEAGQGSRMAIPLTAVARLEEFKRSSIEYSGSQEVVRYRGQILPLIRVARYVPTVEGHGATDSEVLQVVVHTEKGRSVGLVVGRICDIVQETISAKRHAYGNGIFGSVVLQDKVTDLLDVRAVIQSADPSFYPAAAVAHAE